MDCHDCKTIVLEINENGVKNIHCHICEHVFVVNTFILWHPDTLEGCHHECGIKFHQPGVGRLIESEPLEIRLRKRKERKQKQTFRPIIEDSEVGTSDSDDADNYFIHES